MTEYSAQPNYRPDGLTGPASMAKISVMPKRGPYLGMAKAKVPQRRRNYVKAWRLFRKMTVEALAEAADMSQGNLSAIENLRQGYSDESLAKLAHALKTTTGALLNVDPNEGTTGDFWALWGQATADQKSQLAEIARTIVRPKKG